MGVSVYLNRTALRNVVLTLLIPPTEPGPHLSVFATGTGISGETYNPANMSRAHPHVDERGADQDLDEEEAEDLQDELAELLGGDDGTIEVADPEAGRETAHQIIRRGGKGLARLDEAAVLMAGWPMGGEGILRATSAGPPRDGRARDGPPRDDAPALSDRSQVQLNLPAGVWRSLGKRARQDGEAGTLSG
ncbi:hypothetical protein ACH4TS_22080 [Streptomyces albidoflavus]